MLERCLFTGKVSWVDNNCAVIVEESGAVQKYNLEYYRHVIDLPREEKKPNAAGNTNNGQNIEVSQQLG